MNNFEIVTALAIGSIGAIIFLYFMVLKRKGWLTEESKSVTSYLCPNPQCRKVFSGPIKLTDLSQNPPRVYLGCPNCGIDMEKIPAAISEKSKQGDQDSPPSKPMIQQVPHPEQSRDLPDKAPSAKNLSSAGVQTSLQSKPSQKSFFRTPKPVETVQKPQADKPSKNCQHYLGYVKTLPKSTPIPDECMWCTSIVKCLTGAEEIEA